MDNVNRTRIAGFLPVLVLMLVSTPAFAQVDFSGEWFHLWYEDPHEYGSGPDIGDYTGMPVNDANRMRADTEDPNWYAQPVWQCRPHGVEYMTYGMSDLRVSKIVDPVTGRLIGFRMHWLRSARDREIWLDERPHPSEYAPHTLEGFSTGKWEGDTLVITVTHTLGDYIRRNGLQRSPMSMLREYLFMDGDYLTWTNIVYDPAYLTEPLIRNLSYRRVPHQQIPAYPCPVVEELVRPKNWVAHYVPGTNPYLTEFAAKRDLPLEATRGGAETIYPEYQLKLKQLYREATKPAP
jgi:hypothetical protein